MKIILILIVFFIQILASSYAQQNSDTVSDIDGNIYHAIKIGNQIWLLENLKTTKYRNGKPIPNINDSTWCSLKTGGYCNYNNDSTYSQIFGRLYNWYAVNDSGNIAPAGYHVATRNDWLQLIAYVSENDLWGERIAGKFLKEKGKSNWGNKNKSSNKFGFTALPAGERSCFQAVFAGIKSWGSWWTSSEYTEYPPEEKSDYKGLMSWSFTINQFSPSLVSSGSYKTVGMSVRCVKD